MTSITNMQPLSQAKPGTLIAVLSLLLLASTSMNAQKKKVDPCANPQTQTEMNICAGKAYEAADAVLNQVYQKLRAMLDEGEKTQLKEAQTAWLAYRDRNCEFVADQYKGGTIRPMIYAGCLTDVTKNRTNELKAQIKDRDQ